MDNNIEPDLQSLIDTWSSIVIEGLKQMGDHRWPPHQEKQGLLKRPKAIQRFAIEGPIPREGDVLWALSHTISPSTFDIRGNLTEGEREYWIVGLSPGKKPVFRVDGAKSAAGIPADQAKLQAALDDALAAGPRRDRFYGNRGPLSHPRTRNVELK
jgi:hypothetical protein